MRKAVTAAVAAVSRKHIVASTIALATMAVVIAGCGSGTSPQSHSPAYHVGYTSGSSTLAHNVAIETGESPDSACSITYPGASVLNPNLDENEYQTGCLAGFHDHPVQSH
jgi:hypothetical protein